MNETTIKIDSSCTIPIEIQDHNAGKDKRTEKYFKIIELIILTFTAFSFMYMSGVKGVYSIISLALLIIVIIYSIGALFIIGELFLCLGTQPKFLSKEWVFYYGDRIAYVMFVLALLSMLTALLTNNGI